MNVLFPQSGLVRNLFNTIFAPLTFKVSKFLTKQNLSRRIQTKTDLINANYSQVTLVGAGPGDPGLLTMHAYHAMQQADVALVDWLVSPEIRKLLCKATQQIFVGKKCGKHAMTQEAICQLMVDLALEGKRVVRLKGGDPSIFARVAEEGEALQKHNIDYQIIPGITSAAGASAYSGIPLTHRDCAQSVRFVTAHLKKGQEQLSWPQLTTYSERETIVVYMGLTALQGITEHLINIGMPASMPAAVIDQATLAGQRIVIGSLQDITEKVIRVKFTGPSIIIIGEVVNRRLHQASASNGIIESS